MSNRVVRVLGGQHPGARVAGTRAMMARKAAGIPTSVADPAAKPKAAPKTGGCSRCRRG